MTVTEQEILRAWTPISRTVGVHGESHGAVQPVQTSLHWKQSEKLLSDSDAAAGRLGTAF